MRLGVICGGILENDSIKLNKCGAISIEMKWLAPCSVMIYSDLFFPSAFPIGGT